MESDAMNGMHIRDARGGDRFFIDNHFIRSYGKIVGPYGIAVYNALALHAGIEDQEAWPSYDTIADLIGCSRRQVIRVIQQLESLTIIQIQERKTKEGRRTSNGIVLLHKDEWQPISSDSQSPPAVTHSHPDSDSQSPEQDSLEQDPTNKGAANAATGDGRTNGHPKEPDFLPPAEIQMELLFAGRTAGSSQAYAYAEQALMRSGWNIRKKEIKDAAIHFLAATGWEVPRDDGIRKDWIKQLNSHVVEFGTSRLYDLYREVFKTAKFDLSRPGSFTKAMSAIKNNGSSDRKHVKDDWTNDPQYQAFANQPEEEYIPWSTILNKS